MRARVRALLDAAVDAAGPARGPRSARDASDAGAARARARRRVRARGARLARDRDHALARRDEPAETLATGDGDLLPWLPALVSSPSRARAASSARWRATRSANPEAFPRDRDPAAAAADAPARPPRHAAFTLDALIDAVVANTLANDASAVAAAVSRDDARGPRGSDRKPPLVDVSASVAPRAARRELRLVGVVSAYAACVAASPPSPRTTRGMTTPSARYRSASRSAAARGVADLAARFGVGPRRGAGGDPARIRAAFGGRSRVAPAAGRRRARAIGGRARSPGGRGRGGVGVRFVASAGGGGEKTRAAGSAPGVGALLGRGAFAATRDVVAALGGAVVDATTVRSDACVRADRLVSIALAFPVLLASEASFDDSADDSDASDFDDSDFEGFDPASSSFSRNAADGVGARESPIAVLHPSLGAPRRAHARGVFEGGEIRVCEPATDAECAAYFESDVDAEGAEDAEDAIARARASRAPVGRPPVALVASSAALETRVRRGWRAAAGCSDAGAPGADALGAEIASGALRGEGFVALAGRDGGAYREAVRAALGEAAAARPTRAAGATGTGTGGRAGAGPGARGTTTTTTTRRSTRRGDDDGGARAKAAKAAAAFAAERADAALDARFRTTPPARGDSAASSSPTRRLTPGSVSAGVPLAASPAPASSLEGAAGAGAGAGPGPATDGWSVSGDELAGLSVLVVEDNQFQLRIVRATLKGSGVSLDVAMHGGEAVEAVRRKIRDGGAGARLYDVVLMDSMMPVMDGREATVEIRALERAHRAAAPAEALRPGGTLGPERMIVIGLSAEAGSEYEASAREAGMDGAVAKPCRPETMRRTLREVKAGKWKRGAFKTTSKRVTTHY